MNRMFTGFGLLFVIISACQTRNRGGENQLSDLISTDVVPQSFIGYGVGLADRGILSWSGRIPGAAPRIESFELNASEFSPSGKLKCKDHDKNTLEVQRIVSWLELQSSGVDATKTLANGRGEVRVFSIIEEDLAYRINYGEVAFHLGRINPKKQNFYLSIKAFGVASSGKLCNLLGTLLEMDAVRKLVLLTFKKSNERLKSISEEGRSDIEKRFLSFHEKGFKESTSDIPWDFLPKQRPHEIKFKNSLSLNENDRVAFTEIRNLPASPSFHTFSLCDGIHVEQLRNDGPPNLDSNKIMHYGAPWTPLFDQRLNGFKFDTIFPPELLLPDKTSLAPYRFIFSQGMNDELRKIRSDDSMEQYSKRVDFIWSKFRKCGPLEVTFK